MPHRCVDLNCDLGESFGAYTLGHDERVMPHISSANIACGFHAGDPTVMRETVRLCAKHGVAVGAHPGFPDLVGFGRRNLDASPQEVDDMVLYQVGALASVARAEGVRLQHVKPHGALYNMAAADRRLADAVARAVVAVDPALRLVGRSGSCVVDAGRALGLEVVSEGFADRAYDAQGQLVSRSRAGAVIDEPGAVVARALSLATEGVVLATTGERVAVQVDTICVHGDTPGAAELAGAINQALREAGVEISAPCTARSA